MRIRLGDREFDDIVYDADGDVLYLSRGAPVPAACTLVSPEGHAIRLNAADEIVGITVVNATWLAERDGRITVTIPRHPLQRDVSRPQPKIWRQHSRPD